MNPTGFFHVDLATILNLVSTVAIVGALIFTALQCGRAIARSVARLPSR